MHIGEGPFACLKMFSGDVNLFTNRKHFHDVLFYNEDRPRR